MKVMIAMSGGVDSSVAAFIEKKNGNELVGATMQLFQNEAKAQDFKDAKDICDKLSFNHIILDFKDDFKKYVIDKFVSSYENGLTPNPCVDCNIYMKFGKLIDKAKGLGFDKIATGHYARIEKIGDEYFLKKAKDLSKDQSYVLYGIKKEYLSMIDFPLGELYKTDVRVIAREYGFVNSEKKDSEDLCFVPEGDYKKVLKNISSKEYKSGDFVLSSGEIIGRHNGIINYTIGQRKGLGIAYKEPLYVIDVDIYKNQVILGKNEDLYKETFFVKNINWLVEHKSKSFRASVKVRYKHKEEPATIYIQDENKARVVFDKKVRAITKGQSAVFYDDDLVLGGGEIY